MNRSSNQARAEGVPYRRWFKHGKWPKFWRWLHWYTLASFVLLLASGLALYVPLVHTPLIPYLPAIYGLHILLGLVFGITLLAPLIHRLPTGKTIWRLDWLFPLMFGAGIVLTGVFLWLVTVFPTSWRSAGFKWHGDLSYILGVWILIHAYLKAIGYRPFEGGFAGKVDPERRTFVKWLSTGVIGAGFLAIFDPFSALARLFSSSSSGAGGIASSGFAAYYTVTGDYPSVKLTEYRLQVDGAVEAPVVLTFHDLVQLPSYRETVDFHCVTGWSVPNVHWDGVHLSTLAQHVKPHASVRYVNFYSFDGAYTESMTLQEALDASVLLAYQLNHKPLSQAGGYPLRLVVPKMFGYKSIKWVNRVVFSETPLVGYWEQRGYPTEAYISQGM